MTASPATFHQRHCCDEVEWLDSRESVIGTDTRIRRALPHRERRMIGAWCFLDHAGPVQFAAGRGLHVGPHPHIGLQTFTWMIEGEIQHRDSLGYDQVIRAGQVNLMTSGQGIVHSEDSVVDGGRLHTAQLWIALPDEARHIAPAFDHYPELPVLNHNGSRLTVLVGQYLTHQSPVQVYSPLIGVDVQLDAGASLTLELDPQFEHGLMVLEGELQLEQHDHLATGTLLYLPPGHAQLHLGAQRVTRALLIGGAPFEEPVVLWWNFVARTEEEIRAAVQAWNQQPDSFGALPVGSAAQPLLAPDLQGARIKSAASAATASLPPQTPPQGAF